MVQAPVTLEQFRSWCASGRVASGAAVELVAGVVLAAAPPSAAVLTVVADLATALDRALPGHRVAVREAVALGDHDLLRPEVALLRPVWGRDGIGRPTWPSAGFTPATALDLAVFIGSVEAPLRWRAQRCARAGVPEAWTVAVGEGRASRWRLPQEGRYQRREPLPAGEAVSPDAAPDSWIVAWQRPRPPPP
jgi:hypothetical protein